MSSRTGKEIWINTTTDTERQILAREQALRAWFTRDAGPLLAEIDGLDIGWGGVQRWVTGRISLPKNTLHLDLACGYGTFLAQLGWRFPSLRLIGLNIDFAGPHSSIHSLLAEAGVQVQLLQADARKSPFLDASIDSVSCFLGLQDIQIGFGEQGARATVREAVRVLRAGGILILIDAYAIGELERLTLGFPVSIIDRCERPLDIRWDRDVAAAAIRLYADGYVAQMRLEPGNQALRQAAFRSTLERMRKEAKIQFTNQGYFVPFGPARMLVCRKENDSS